MTLDQPTADKVFEAALAARFHPTNLGLTGEVWVDGYTYRVVVTETERACTDVRAGWGDAEYTFASASPEQDRALREAIANPN
ncbi:hypothetical protein HUT19_41900 (plasmid) [Streptomyces sp. NA02950]|uniref:hypothetical protein n=1 Tax=Streptomyces sp. NA02950 TaxID=2742137 RepID=UPI001591339A|nr:hypothetical protein [Streptomyces sp. NA02950]QKV98274.1 hypothetical protein HUT19_41900 [Streptomyces sp. NA02950]